jgi:hypothetical protein
MVGNASAILCDDGDEDVPDKDFPLRPRAGDDFIGMGNASPRLGDLGDTILGEAGFESIDDATPSLFFSITSSGCSLLKAGASVSPLS